MLRPYEHSLGIAMLTLFALPFAGHLVTGARAFSAEISHGEPTVSSLGYLFRSHFWFESLQNWQSEALAVGSLVVFSVYLRQRGSPESKPVHAPYASTGADYRAARFRRFRAACARSARGGAPRDQQLPALLCSLAALVLCPSEEPGQLLVAFTIGVLNVRLETERVAEADFGEPEESSPSLDERGSRAATACGTDPPKPGHRLNVDDKGLVVGPALDDPHDRIWPGMSACARRCSPTSTPRRGDAQLRD